jgi:hypothetical protein
MNEYAQAAGSDVRHLVAEVRDNETVTLCGTVLVDAGMVSEDQGDLCQRCLVKAT